MRRVTLIAVAAIAIGACGGGGAKPNPFIAVTQRCDDLVGTPVVAEQWEKGCSLRKAGATEDSIALSLTYHCVDGTSDIVIAADEIWGRVGELGQRGKPPDDQLSACAYSSSSS